MNMDGLGIIPICALAISTLFCTYKWVLLAKPVKRDPIRYGILGLSYAALLPACALLLLALAVIYIAPSAFAYVFDYASEIYRISILSATMLFLVNLTLLTQKWFLKRFPECNDTLEEIGLYPE